MSVYITFQAMDGTPEIRDAIGEHFANLEQRFGPVRSCRVVIKGLGAGDHADGTVTVTLAWYGRTV